MNARRIFVLTALAFMAALLLGLAQAETEHIMELDIVTEDGAEPACEAVSPPNDSLWGTTIKNNNYVNGTLTVTWPEGERSTYSMKIKVRGNTSALASDKKPYKIKLSEKSDLLNPGGSNPLREWVLLTDATDLRTYTGFLLGKLCGVEWQTDVRFVCVTVNGDFRGCYLLLPAVTQKASEGLVSKDGFIFENDAYWWDTDIYFKLSRQIYGMGYTFKYPDFESRGDAKLKWLKGRMQKIENLLYDGDEAYTQYFDAESAAKWLLIRDIMADVDGAGANMFFYKYDASNGTKIKMGPLWDFTGAFLNDTPQWSGAHTQGTFWFNELLLSDAFYAAYTETWQNIYPTVLSDIASNLDSLYRSEGAAIDECLRRDAERWGKEYSSFENRKDEILKRIEEQLLWMNGQITTTLCRENGIDVSGYRVVRGNLNYYIDSNAVHGARRRTVGWAYCPDGYTGGTIGLLSGETLYTGESVCRPDVQQVFSLPTDMHGFTVICPAEAEITVCIADTVNGILYLP